MARREKACWRRAGNSFLSVAMTLFLICLTLLSSCQRTREDTGQTKAQKASEKSEYHEYMVDSLEVADHLTNLANKVIRLLGRPRGEGLLSEYDWHIVKYSRTEVLRLISEVNEKLVVAKRFDEKYIKRPESRFCSYWTISSIISSPEDIDKYKDDWDSERRWSYIGMKLGSFVYRVEQLAWVADDNIWLFTREDLQKRKKELEKEAVRLKEERARQLEEKFKKK